MDFDEQLYNIKNTEYYLQGRPEMLKFIRPDVHFVLDVGCSAGAFGSLLKKERNCEVWGVEPSDSASEAASVLDKVFHDYFHPGLDMEGRQFDAIVFNDVLEHLANPWEILKYSRTLLKPGGYIVASIPNIQCYQALRNLVWKGEWTYTDSGILDKTHLRFFTRKSIIRLFEEMNFEIVEMEGQNSTLASSRFLRICHFFARRRTEPFLFINYAVCARLI